MLPVVMGIILLAALYAVSAATDLGSASVLATQRLLHQRAFEAGESGIVAVLDQLRSGAAPPAAQQLRSDEYATDAATVESTITAVVAMPNGFSAGRVLERDYEISSTGHSARATNVTVVQGVRQLQALPAP